MNIESYQFGRIVIDGKEYTSDLKIIDGKVVSNWWRREGHSLILEDITELKNYTPKILIVGKGYSGIMCVSEEVKEYCKRENIKLVEAVSKKAVEEFNKVEDKREVLAAFHLTC